MQARIEEVAAVDTLTLHERHGRYPQANSVEDVRRNLAAVQQRIHRNPTERLPTIILIKPVFYANSFDTP